MQRIPQSVTPIGLLTRADMVAHGQFEPDATAEHLRLAAREIRRLRDALTAIAMLKGGHRTPGRMVSMAKKALDGAHILMPHLKAAEIRARNET